MSSGVIKWEHRLEIGQDKMCLFNPFIPNAPFTYPLKTLENLRFSDVFKGWRKGALGTNGLNIKDKRKFPKCAKSRSLVEI